MADGTTCTYAKRHNFIVAYAHKNEYHFCLGRSVHYLVVMTQGDRHIPDNNILMKFNAAEDIFA